MEKEEKDLLVEENKIRKQRLEKAQQEILKILNKYNVKLIVTQEIKVALND